MRECSILGLGKKYSWLKVVKTSQNKKAYVIKDFSQQEDSFLLNVEDLRLVCKVLEKDQFFTKENSFLLDGGVIVQDI